MGGGDLNSKKAWHPNTMKNQERVWKAEQAAANEKKRILELERERAQERDREELNKLNKQSQFSKAESHGDSQLHWMYDKPDKKVQQEDYLLGKSIEKNYDTTKKSEQNDIPAVSRRVVGSSMTTASENVQVDLARKLREDPLLLVKERERAARAALLNNPVQRRKLTELLRKEQEQKKAKSENKSKKNKKDLDGMLAAKINALGGGKVDLAKLLASDDSSSESSSDEDKKKIKKKKKKDKKKKKKKEKHDSDSDTVTKSKSKHKMAEKSSRYTEELHQKSKASYERTSSSKKRKSTSDDSDDDEPSRKSKRDRSPVRSEGEAKYRESRNNDKYKREGYEQTRSRPERYDNYNRDGYERNRNRADYDNHRRDDQSKNRSDNYNNYRRDQEHRSRSEIDNRERDKGNKRGGLSEEEKAARLAEMAAAGAEREVERGQRVAQQLREIAADERVSARPRHNKHNEARALPDSLEDRIHSNRHYIQRDRRHMNENFARR